jgi:hypothetical protein
MTDATHGINSKNQIKKKCTGGKKHMNTSIAMSGVALIFIISILMSLLQIIGIIVAIVIAQSNNKKYRSVNQETQSRNNLE